MRKGLSGADRRNLVYSILAASVDVKNHSIDYVDAIKDIAIMKNSVYKMHFVFNKKSKCVRHYLDLSRSLCFDASYPYPSFNEFRKSLGKLSDECDRIRFSWIPAVLLGRDAVSFDAYARDLCKTMIGLVVTSEEDAKLQLVLMGKWIQKWKRAKYVSA